MQLDRQSKIVQTYKFVRFASLNFLNLERNSDNMKLLSLSLGHPLPYVLVKPHYIIILNKNSFI